MNDASYAAPLTHWSLFRHRLVWAYEAALVRTQRAWPYTPYPTAAWLIRQGSITLRFPTETIVCKPGSWIFPKEAEGIQECSEDLALLSIRFHAEWSCGTPIFDRSQTISIPETESAELTRTARQLIAFVENSFSPTCPESREVRGNFRNYLHLQPLFMEWLCAYEATLTTHGVTANTREQLDPKVRQILQTLERRALSQSPQESELADEAGCSVSQLNKLFVRHTGSTPAALWNRRRLNAAKSELLHGTESIKAIAYHLGFSSPEHFTHWFRKNTGRTPRHFRQEPQQSV